MVCPWPPSWSSPPCSSDCVHFCLFLECANLASALGAAVAFSLIGCPFPFSSSHSVFNFTHKSSSDQWQFSVPPPDHKNLYPDPSPLHILLTLFTFPSSTFHLMYCILYIIIYCLSYSGLNLLIKNVNSGVDFDCFCFLSLL